jgi:DNA-binding MarR family transcriptional regulator
LSSPIRIATDFDTLYPSASATATECAMNLVLTADLLEKRIATLLLPLRLTPTSALVLSMLADTESSLSPNEIADRLIISRATVTGLLDSLERQDYVRRRPHPTDRRMILAEITEAGRQAAVAFRPIVHQQEKEWLGVLDEAEKQQLLSALHRVQDRLRAGG